MEDSKIEWCDDTVNAWIGCAKVSPGCAHCYAEDLDRRKLFGGRTNWGVNAERLDRSDKAVGEIQRIARRAEKEGRPRFVFLSSLCDLFEDRADIVPWRAKVWEALQAANANGLRIVALLLTKRPHIMLAWQREVAPQGLPFWAWVGTSVENQAAADERISILCDVQTDGVRYLSMEPLLGPVTLDLRDRWSGGCAGGCLDEDLYFSLDSAERCRRCGHPLGGTPKCPIGWVIVGGESGKHARPMHPDWARAIRDQCAGAGVPFLFKQWGEWAPAKIRMTNACPASGNSAYSGPEYESLPSYVFERQGEGGTVLGPVMERFGKKVAGRLLDGVTHNGRPPAEEA